MRYVIAGCICLLSGACWASEPNRIYLAVREDISAAARDTILERLRVVVGDRDNVRVAVSELPRWQQTSNTNLIWRVLDIDRNKPRSQLPPLTITADQFETWKDNNLPVADRPKVRARKGDSNQILYDAGLEPKP